MNGLKCLSHLKAAIKLSTVGIPKPNKPHSVNDANNFYNAVHKAVDSSNDAVAIKNGEAICLKCLLDEMYPSRR